MRVLVWNLFHGRADPPAGRPLLHEFAGALADWEWDVALLQEVPPWWPPVLAGRCGADVRAALTSRNQLLPLRRAIACRAPDRLKSNGGGANAILVRPPWSVVAHGRRRLRWCPERRIVHAVRLARPGHGRSPAPDGGFVGALGVTGSPGADAVGGTDRSRPATAGDGLDGAWVGNVHAQLGDWSSPAGMAAPLADLRRAAAQLEAWADTGRTPPGRHRPGVPGAPDGVRPAGVIPPPDGAPDLGATPRSPLVLGGDLNLPRDAVVTALPPGWRRVAGHGPDHVVGRGVHAVEPSSRLDRGVLSDHAPVRVRIAADR